MVVPKKAKSLKSILVKSTSERGDGGGGERGGEEGDEL